MRALKILLILVLLGVIGWHFFIRNHRLSFIPPEMNVSQILYAKEEAWGFGPGGNETGVIVYKLPEDEAARIIAGGINYLESFSSAKLGKPHSWHGKYREWYSTPISIKNESWFEIPASDLIMSTPDVNSYLNKYGFGISLTDDIEEIINTSIAMPGNYYAYGRIGMILVAPSIQRVFYIYNG